MELMMGQIVTSRRGRDVTRPYVVVGMAAERVLLADGAKWTKAAPKPKNPRHLQPTGAVLPAQETDTDLNIKTALKRYAESRGGNQQGG